MKLLMLPLALLAAPLLAQSVRPPLPPELQAGLRCAALFSIVAAEQARGEPAAADWPPLAQRGREFFVRVSAKAMDAGKLDRPALQSVMQAEVKALRASGNRAELKAPCLAMLDANVGPAVRRQP